MENINKLVEKDLLAVETELLKFFSNNEDVYSDLQKFIKSPKKRIRSLVTALYLKAFGKEPNINILVAGELIHNASLLHDDVLDKAETRRGLTTIATKHSPHISILSGDLLVSFATKTLINNNDMQVLEFFQKCTENMSNAELIQYSLRGQIPEINKYLRIIEGKTAALFIAMLKSTVISANLDICHAESFARNFGILFQLKNDLEKVSALTDAKNGIYTVKDILGIEKTEFLIDNYLREIRRDISKLPDNIYKKGLGDLLELL
mgnify:CR=1 FL=1